MMSLFKARKILCLDFDGVCHSYTSGWQGAAVCNDPPVAGLFEFLEQASEHFDIAIFSSRSHQPGGIEAMKRWFHNHYSVYRQEQRIAAGWQSGIDDAVFLPLWLVFPANKPPAHVSIDDRGITFAGVWPEIDLLLNFTPWNKK